MFQKIKYNFVVFSSNALSAPLYLKAQLITDYTNTYKQSPFLEGNEV
jgi:hypothetical protein